MAGLPQPDGSTFGPPIATRGWARRRTAPTGMARVGNIIFALGLVVALVFWSHALSILLTWPSTPPLDPPLSPFVNWFTPERIESHVLAFMGLMMLILGWAARVRLKELEPVEKQEADTLDEEATASSSSVVECQSRVIPQPRA